MNDEAARGRRLRKTSRRRPNETSTPERLQASGEPAARLVLDLLLHDGRGGVVALACGRGTDRPRLRTLLLDEELRDRIVQAVARELDAVADDCLGRAA